MATIDELAAAAVTALNAHDFGVAFTAEQKYLPRIERTKMGDGWHVWVVVSELKRGRIDRSGARKESSFDVGLIRRLAGTTEDIVNPCIAFADAVQSFFETQTLLAAHDLMQNDFDPLYSEAHLKQQTVFLSVLSLTYRRR